MSVAFDPAGALYDAPIGALDRFGDGAPPQRRPGLGPKAVSMAAGGGAVLLWALWPTLAMWAQPAPPFLVFGVAALVGFLAMALRAGAQGRFGAFVSVPPATALLVVVGLGVNNILYLLAIPRIGPAEANIVAYLWPVMLVLLGAGIARAPLSLTQFLGVLVAFAGAATVIGPSFGAGLDWLGVALAFLSGLAFTFFTLARRLLPGGPGDVIGPSLGAVSVVCFALHLGFETTPSLSATQLLATAGAGLGPLAVANMLWDYGARRGDLTALSAMAYGTPLAGVTFLWIFGVAALTPATAVGAGLIVIGALIAARLVKGVGR